MKTLIKTYYSEPQVDSPKILHYIREKTENQASLESFFLPILGIGILLLGFFSFLFMMNVEFLSTAIRVYSALGGVLFILMNLIVGTLLFILEHSSILISSIALIFAIQVSISSGLLQKRL